MQTVLKVISTALCLAVSLASLSEPWIEEDNKESIMSTDYVQGSLWPKPCIYNASEKVFSLASSDFSFNSTGETSDVLTEALERYRSLVFPDPMEKCKATLPKITKLTVKVEEKYSPQSLETDESCKFNIEESQFLVDAYKTYPRGKSWKFKKSCVTRELTLRD